MRVSRLVPFPARGFGGPLWMSVRIPMGRRMLHRVPPRTRRFGGLIPPGSGHSVVGDARDSERVAHGNECRHDLLLLRTDVDVAHERRVELDEVRLDDR